MTPDFSQAIQQALQAYRTFAAASAPAQVTVTCASVQGTLAIKRLGTPPKHASAHEAMAYAVHIHALNTAVEGVWDAVRALPIINPDVFTLTFGLSNNKNPKMSIMGAEIVVHQEHAFLAHLSSLASALARLPAHNGRTFAVNGLLLSAPNAGTASLVAQLLRRGHPTTLKGDDRYNASEVFSKSEAQAQYDQALLCLGA